MSKDYNGWKNRATWIVNLHIGEANLHEDFQIAAHVGGAMQFETHFKAHMIKWPEDEVTTAMITAGLETVDWNELAEIYASDYNPKEI